MVAADGRLVKGPLRRNPTLPWTYTDDWALILKLGSHSGVDGLITCDLHMIQQPPEMVALGRTHLVLVLVEGGDQALAPTGLVMVHAEKLASIVTGKPQILKLRLNQSPQQISLQRRINLLASRKRLSPPELIRREVSQMADTPGMADYL